MVINEILRNQIGSEVRYIHQVLGETLLRSELVVPAHCLGNILFRFKEREHLPLESTVAEFLRIEVVSTTFVPQVNPGNPKRLGQSLWGRLVTAESLMEPFFEHNSQHQGQIPYLYTYFTGPPDL